MVWIEMSPEIHMLKALLPADEVLGQWLDHAGSHFSKWVNSLMRSLICGFLSLPGNERNRTQGLTAEHPLPSSLAFSASWLPKVSSSLPLHPSATVLCLPTNLTAVKQLLTEGNLWRWQLNEPSSLQVVYLGCLVTQWFNTWWRILETAAVPGVQY